MSRLHQSYRPEREANERFEEREIAARKRQSEQDLKRHITWFNKTAESNHLNVEDFSDGLTVARWARFQVPNEGSNLSRDEKIENNRELLAFLSDCGVKLVGIQADDLTDSNVTIVSGLLWTLRLFKDVTGGEFIRDPLLQAKESGGSQALGGSNDDISNLRALYTAGFIGDEEFKRRLKELGGSVNEESHDYFTCSCQRRQCSNCTKLVKECCVDDHTNMCASGSINCPICEEKLSRSVFSQHLEKCRVVNSTTPDVFDLFKCSWCTKEMSIAYKADHDIVCLSIKKECPMKQWGCNVEPTRQEFFSHIMECRKLFTERNDLATSTCEFCGTVISYSKAWEDETEGDKAERDRINTDIGGHYCAKKFVCPLHLEGCEFVANDRGTMIKHLEEDCLNNFIICHFCNESMKRSDSLTHKCCDFARAQVGVPQLVHAGIINNNFLVDKDEKK